MKSLVVISTSPVPEAAGRAPAVPERRMHQRRMGLARRVGAISEEGERRGSDERRGAGTRRRRPDRRIGLSPDLDLYLIGI